MKDDIVLKPRISRAFTSPLFSATALLFCLPFCFITLYPVLKHYISGSMTLGAYAFALSLTLFFALLWFATSWRMRVTKIKEIRYQKGVINLIFRDDSIHEFSANKDQIFYDEFCNDRALSFAENNNKTRVMAWNRLYPDWKKLEQCIKNDGILLPDFNNPDDRQKILERNSTSHF